MEVTPIVSGLVGAVGGHEWRRYREQQRKAETEVEDWFDDCQNLASRGNQTVYRAGLRSEIGYDAILGDLSDFSDQLYVKARNYPEGVPDEAANHVGTLSELYSKASSVAEVNSQKQGIEILTELFEMAQRESYPEMDFTELMNNAGDMSDGFGHLLAALNDNGVTTEEFAETVEDIFEEWDSEDFAFFMTYADIGEIVQLVMRLFLQMVSQLSDMTYEYLEEQKQELI